LQETMNWMPIEKYLNSGLSIMKLCTSTSGLFARGPIQLMEAYKVELELHEMKPTIVGAHHPQKNVNEYDVEEMVNIKVLFIGDSYIIGQSFRFKRLN
jgi:hypothetical protein